VDPHATVLLSSLLTALAVYVLRTNGPTPFWERAWWYSWTVGVWLWMVVYPSRMSFALGGEQRDALPDETG
jgi:hypothetical protein